MGSSAVDAAVVQAALQRSGHPRGTQCGRAALHHPTAQRHRLEHGGPGHGSGIHFRLHGRSEEVTVVASDQFSQLDVVRVESQHFGRHSGAFSPLPSAGLPEPAGRRNAPHAAAHSAARPLRTQSDTAIDLFRRFLPV